MATTSNEPLSKEQQEEEEMRNELMNSGFFYDKMDIEEMRQTIKMLKKNKENNHSQNTNSTQNESKLTQSTIDTLDPTANKHSSSFLFKQTLTSDDLSIPSTSSENPYNNKENSPNLALSKVYEKNTNNGNTSSDSELNFEKNLSHNKNDYSTLENKSISKSNTLDLPRLRPRESRKSTAGMIKKANLERWRLNPLESWEDEPDIPLKPPERVHTQQEDELQYSNKELDSETFDALCQQWSSKLDSLHERIIPDLLIKERKSIWGSPIKVGTSKQVPPY